MALDGLFGSADEIALDLGRQLLGDPPRADAHRALTRRRRRTDAEAVVTDFDATDFFVGDDVRRRPVSRTSSTSARSARCSASRTTTS